MNMKLCLGLLTFVVGALCLVGCGGQKVEVKPGQFVVYRDKLKNPIVLAPGTHMIGDDTTYAVLSQGAPFSVQDELDLVPGTLDKVAVAGRESLIVNLLPIAGKLTRDKRIEHVLVPITISGTLPSEVRDLYVLFSAFDGLDPIKGIEKLAWNVLRDNERLFKQGLLDRFLDNDPNHKFSEDIKAPELAEAIKASIKLKSGLDVNVKVGQPRRETRDIEDDVVEGRKERASRQK